MAIDANRLETIISERLDEFYRKRISKLEQLPLINTLKRKNPYLYRAIGVSDASEIVEEILKAHVSSSDETLFGNEFFEPLAKIVAQEANKDNALTIETSDGEGVDITIKSDKSNIAIAVKSGVNVFNADSKKRQTENFAALRRRLQKLALHFDPVVGYCYGKKSQTSRSKVDFRELAGENFWAFLTGEQDFYLRIIRLMEQKPNEHRLSFQESFDKAKNRFTKQFLDDFSNEDGSIDWEKLLEFNSGINKNPNSKSRQSRSDSTEA